MLQTKLKVLSQLYKGNRRFKNIKSAFKGCLIAIKPQDSEQLLIKSYLVDIYCKVDYLKHKEFIEPNAVYLEEAEKVVGPKIKYL